MLPWEGLQFQVWQALTFKTPVFVDSSCIAVFGDEHINLIWINGWLDWLKVQFGSNLHTFGANAESAVFSTLYFCEQARIVGKCAGFVLMYYKT
jgi:ABC-type glucose/galactose transport system permease subunit